jgi:hypothetical protein
LKPLGVLDDSPETSLSVTFLLALPRDGKRLPRCGAQGHGCRRDRIVPEGRWEDFETYWSCSSWGIDDLLGKKVERNDLHKQNTFSMFWTAEALLETYRATGKREFLTLGERVLDELLMAQASWQPPYMYVDVLGGFGVMNADGEWNDSREACSPRPSFATGGALTGGIRPTRACGAPILFVMMYAPRIPGRRSSGRRPPFFGPRTTASPWRTTARRPDEPRGRRHGSLHHLRLGNGAAAEAYNRMVDHFGPELVQRNR